MSGGNGRHFSILHWRFRDEFPEVWSDDHAFALWCRLLMDADIAYPHPASLPATTRKAALAMLVEAELITVLPAGRFTIRGQEKERERRVAAGRHAATVRWQSRRDA